MPNDPKISKHRSGQHPTLQSFRAFDIIPPNKVKPAHTARPVITSTEPQHFDTTLAPKKAEKPKLEQPAPTEVKLPEDAASAEPVPAEPAEVPTDNEVQRPEQPQAAEPAAEDEPTTKVEDSPAVEESDENKPEASEMPADTTGLATPEVMPANPIPAPDSPAGVIEKEMEQDAPNLLDKKVTHTEEFTRALQELAAHSELHKTSTKPIVAVHQHDYMRVLMLCLLWLAIFVVTAVIVIDILLDTHALQTAYNIPHTHFFTR